MLQPLPPPQYCTIHFLVEIVLGENIFSTMDDGKSDHPAPIIPPPHSSNYANSAHTYSAPIIISTSILAHQVKVIDNSGIIPIIVGFNKIFT